MANQPLIMLNNWYFVLLIPVIVYTVVLVLFSIVLLIPKKKHTENSGQADVSIIVAARNEEENLPLLLEDLSQQVYPHKLIEVIIVDDHSELPVRDSAFLDNHNFRNIKVLELEKDVEGKKMALKKGAMEASSNTLLFTDADCRLPSGWVARHMQAFAKAGSSMNIGLTSYSESKNLLQTFFYLDITALNLCSAATALLMHPVMCSGANLSVDRKIYLQLADKLKMHIPSGDDVFLLHEMKKLKGKNIHLLLDQNSIVTTAVPSGLREFLDQRSRWVSKSKHYSDTDIIIIAILVLLANLSFLILLLMSFSDTGRNILLLAFILKTIADGLIFTVGYKYYNTLKYLVFLPLFELCYPFYMLISLIRGYFKLFSWKNRKATSSIY